MNVSVFEENKEPNVIVVNPLTLNDYMNFYHRIKILEPVKIPK